MIVFDDVTFTYPGAKGPILDKVSMEIAEGELALVVGPTGSGKSTFLRLINGLVPHFTGGHLRGRVSVNGRETSTHPPRELADIVGMVPQDPLAAFVTDTVEEELAYTMECLGIDGGTMRKRIEETLDLLGIAGLRDRPLTTLSGGERQRVAIGAVLTAHPRVLVLDEPTSALDPGAADEVLSALQRLVHDIGMTVVMAEHRLERVVEYADQVIVVHQPQAHEAASVTQGEPTTMMRATPIAPPVVRLGRLAGWDPLPLSVRDARRSATTLRGLLVGCAPTVRAVPQDAESSIDVSGLVVAYGANVAVRDIDLHVSNGAITALMGRNGAGKSTLLGSLVGMTPKDSGRVRVNSVDPFALGGSEILQHIGLVPQEPAQLLEAITVADECRRADHDSRAEPGTTRALLALLAPEITDDTHPRDLSEGQRLLLALAIVLGAKPRVVCLDEPTRGLDYPTKARLGVILRDLAEAGHTVVLSTHDVELVAEIADRVLIMAGGELVADGPTREVITSSPLFAPQVAKVLAPEPFMTVDAVSAALDARGRSA